MSTQAAGSLYVLLVILGLVLIVCWIILPFAVIGTKPLLKSLLREQRRTNSLLEQLGASAPHPVKQDACAATVPGATSSASVATKPDLFDRIADAIERRQSRAA